jgi:hypothetical protein
MTAFKPHSAELMVDPGCGGRRAIRDTGAAGPDRYHWTVTVFDETDPVAAGRTGELMQARSQAETALRGSGCRSEGIAVGG